MHATKNLKTFGDKSAIVLLSGSAGELDWILPIIDSLIKNRFVVKMIFLTRHVRNSVKENKMLETYISNSEKIESIILGSALNEVADKISYLSFRLSLKIKLRKKFHFGRIFNLFDKAFEVLFFSRLPNKIKNLSNRKNLIFMEYPSLRRPRDLWIKNHFGRSLFFYFPHSPHIYTEDIDKTYLENDEIDLSKKQFLLLGHPGDFGVINDGNELASASLEKVYIGHPKYSNNWLKGLNDKAQNFRNSMAKRDKVNILVLSRGSGSYLDEEGHSNLVETTINEVSNIIPNYNILVKKHPRETNSHWDKHSNNSSIKIVNDHILKLAIESDLVISYWTSGAMDCFILGVPVIEYFDPNRFNKQQVPDNSGYTTIYRKLGIAISANTKLELRKSILSLKNCNFKITSNAPHPHYKDLINRSNNWQIKFESILRFNNLI